MTRVVDARDVDRARNLAAQLRCECERDHEGHSVAVVQCVACRLGTALRKARSFEAFEPPFAERVS